MLGKTGNCHRLEETKEIQLHAVQDPGLDSGTEKGHEGAKRNR